MSQQSLRSTIRRYSMFTLCTCLIVFAILCRQKIKKLLPEEITYNVGTIIDMRDNGR